MFTRPSYSSHTTPSTMQDMAIISKMGPTTAVGLLKLMVLRQNPPVGSAPPRANRAMDKATQKDYPGGFLHSPLYGLSRQGLPRKVTSNHLAQI
jgi:hypothetical protein